ncbi:MAG: 3-deoxy-manno-octulosonate cytidylyltransferase, partial [Lentisphaeria bacterium]
MKKHVTAIIPARYGSTRFPGKPLFELCGKPMIQWTYERTKKAKLIDRVIVATDDALIYDCVKSFGGEVVMTSANHPSGTDRIAEAISNLETDLVINVQGDEPTIPSEVIDELIEVMLADDEAQMGTVAVGIDRDSEDFSDPNVVKVVVGHNNNGLYFSRAAIPYLRDGGDSVRPLKHWGIYAYTPELIRNFVKWPESDLEKCEKLEQLRAMENGVKIKVIQT